MSIKQYYTSLTLPDCATKVNGVYLEKSVIGFRTCGVEGREPMDVDITSLTVGNSNGAKYQRKRDQTRTISISYTLFADNYTMYHKLMDKLKNILHGSELRFIFKDESNVFYTGTVESISADPVYYTEAVGCSGTISVFCADPYKYSTKLYKVKPKYSKGHRIIMNYNGKVPSYPTFQFKFKTDNGWIGMTNQKGKILEFGNASEVDGKKVKDETLVTLTKFFNSKDDINGKDYMHPLYGAKGKLGKKKWFGKNFLALSSVGTKVGDANGGLRTVNIPADSTGSTSCKNFYCYWHLIFYAGLMGQTGEMCINFLTDDNKLICGLNWAKTDDVGNRGFYEMVVYNPNKKDTDKQAGTIVNRFEYTTSHIQRQNPWYWDWGHCDVRKEGADVTFYYNSGYYKYTIPEIKNMSCRKIQIAIKQWGDRSGKKYLTFAGFDKLSFRKLMKEHWVDSDNSFDEGDIFKINTQSMRCELNGIKKTSLGKLANDWDDFVLSPGKNQIKIYWSSFCKKLDITMYYREVFL